MKHINTMIATQNITTMTTTQEILNATSEQHKLAWLRDYKIWDNKAGEWKTYNWQTCKLGGHCFNDNGHENQDSTRNWKDYEEEKGERDYNYYLLAQEGRTYRVACECLAVKDGDQRILFIKEKGRKTWDNKGFYCEKHAEEQKDWYIKNQEPNPWAKKGGPVLQHDPIYGVNFEAVKQKAEELYKKPFRT